MKIKNRFTKICVLSVITYKENYDEDFYIKIRYLVNEFQPKLQELILLTSYPFFCLLFGVVETESSQQFRKLLCRDHEETIINWAVEYVACLYRFI